MTYAGAIKAKAQRAFSVAHRERTRGNSCLLQHGKFHLDIRKSSFHYEVGQAQSNLQRRS